VTGGTAGDVARSYLASFAAGDPATIAAHVAPGFLNEHASALGAGSHGRAAYLERLPGFLASFRGLRYEVVSVIGGTAVGAGTVAVEYRMTATNDGHRVDVPGVMAITVVDGLIARRTDYWDSLTFLRQIGAAPAVTGE
jgi:ketosteroid isomerase-like protein